jgi:excisionase family DNA binding protein
MDSHADTKIRGSLGGSNRLLDMHEAAAYLAVPYSSLRRYRSRWGLRSVHVGRSVKFRLRDLDAFIERHEAG